MPLIEASEAIRILADTDDVIEDSDDQEDISALVKIISKSMLRVSFYRPSQIVQKFYKLKLKIANNSLKKQQNESSNYSFRYVEVMGCQGWY